MWGPYACMGRDPVFVCPTGAKGGRMWAFISACPHAGDIEEGVRKCLDNQQSQLDMLVNTSNPGTHKTEAGGSLQVWGQNGLQREFQAKLGYKKDHTITNKRNQQSHIKMDLNFMIESFSSRGICQLSESSCPMTTKVYCLVNKWVNLGQMPFFPFFSALLLGLTEYGDGWVCPVSLVEWVEWHVAPASRASTWF